MENRYEKMKEEAKKRNEKRRKIVKIEKSVITFALATFVAISAKQFYNEKKGEYIIRDGFRKDVLSGVSNTDSQNEGLNFYIGTTRYSYEDAIDYFKNEAEEHGYNDVQTYIALKGEINSNVAKDVVGRSIDSSDIIKEAYKTYNTGSIEKEEGVSYGK